MSEFGVRAAGAVLGVGLLIGESGCTAAEQPAEIPKLIAPEVSNYTQLKEITVHCADVVGVGTMTEESCDAAVTDVRNGIDLIAAMLGRDVSVQVGVVMLKDAITPENLNNGRCANILTPEGKAQAGPFIESIVKGAIPQLGENVNRDPNAAYIAVNAPEVVCPDDVRTIHGFNSVKAGSTTVVQLFGPNHTENANRVAHELLHSGPKGIGHDALLSLTTGDPYHLKGDETAFTLSVYGINSIMGDYKQIGEPYLAAPHALQLGAIEAEYLSPEMKTTHTLTTHVPGTRILQAGPVRHEGILQSIRPYIHDDINNLRYFLSRSRTSPDEARAGADVYIALMPKSQKGATIIVNIAKVDAEHPSFVDEASGFSVSYESSSDQGVVVTVLDR